MAVIVDRDTNARAVYQIDPATGDPLAGAGSLSGVYNTTSPTLTNGQTSPVQLDTRGSVNTVLMSANTNSPIFSSAGNSDTLTSTSIGIRTHSMGLLFDGTNLVRQRGDVTAAFVKAPPRAHTASAVVAGSGASQQLFAANATRSKLLIQNQDAAINVFVNLGAAATTTPPSMRIAPGSTLELTGTNATVNLIAASGTPAIAAWEF